MARPRLPEPEHGYWRRYYNPRFRCRCDACRSAMRDYVRGHKRPSRFTCPGCGHRCATAQGHPGCNPEHVSEILPRVLSSFGGR